MWGADGGSGVTVYLAGKIAGDPNYKAKFAEAQGALESLDYIVLSPAWLPGQGFEYDAYLRISDALRRECDAVCFLPGWVESRGAMKEHRKAKEQGQKIMFYSEVMRNA